MTWYCSHWAGVRVTSRHVCRAALVRGSHQGFTNIVPFFFCHRVLIQCIHMGIRDPIC